MNGVGHQGRQGPSGVEPSPARSENDTACRIEYRPGLVDGRQAQGGRTHLLTMSIEVSVDGVPTLYRSSSWGRFVGGQWEI
jgi:hypothetical protein